MSSTHRKPLCRVLSGLMILILIMVASAWAQSSFKPIPASQLNKAERDKAARIADTEFKNWRSGKFEPLTDAFTDQMRAALTAELQRSAYQQTKALFGDYQSLVFAEAVASPDMPGTTVYRFRGTFDKTQDKPEIRVVTDSAGKVSGFWIKPWADQLQ